ncbi:hypothetical protein TNCV_530461 [Trichonephila clavipes]|nr:hypothetical protein TNCV_530461 [Trichonephila clavipes]
MHSTLAQWLGNSGRHHVAILESAGPPDDTTNIQKKQNNKRTGIRYLKKNLVHFEKNIYVQLKIQVIDIISER